MDKDEIINKIQSGEKFYCRGNSNTLSAYMGVTNNLVMCNVVINNKVVENIFIIFFDSYIQMLDCQSFPANGTFINYDNIEFGEAKTMEELFKDLKKSIPEP